MKTLKKLFWQCGGYELLAVLAIGLGWLYAHFEIIG